MQLSIFSGMKLKTIKPLLILFLLTLGFSVQSQEKSTDYLSDAHLIDPSGNLHSGVMAIHLQLNRLNFQKESSYSTKRLEANRDGSIHYEIAGFKNSDGILYKQVLIWRKLKDDFKKELEFVAKSGTTEDLSSEIDEARARWMKYCNAHMATELVNQVYSKNPFYYNNGRPIITTSEALIREYSYMNNPQYSLKLTPLVIEPVTDELVYEIGQCSGSYGGKYVIIWTKEDGIWKVLLDSNI